MPTVNLAQIQLPPAVAGWIDRFLYLFLGLVLRWVVLKVIGFSMRRAYNLTPAGTAKSKNLKPDFLKVDHRERERLIDRGRQFDEAQEVPVKKALNAAGFGVIASGLVSFVSAAFFALGRIEDYDEIWRNLSARERFVAIVQSHPFGFAVALLIIIGGLIRLVPVLRRAK
jgi:hypothetical protein